MWDAFRNLPSYAVSEAVLVTIAGTAALLWVWQPWRKRLQSSSLCAACGYDLTGNVSGTCPECGEKVG